MELTIHFPLTFPRLTLLVPAVLVLEHDGNTIATAKMIAAILIAFFILLKFSYDVITQILPLMFRLIPAKHDSAKWINQKSLPVNTLYFLILHLQNYYTSLWIICRTSVMQTGNI